MADLEEELAKSTAAPDWSALGGAGDRSTVVSLETIRSSVNQLRTDHAAHDDPERDHAAEDAIWEAALRMIADGCADPAVVAAEALKTTGLDIGHWYA